MAAYFPGSNIQPETMQTLYLMNPEYAGYAEMANPGNIVLLNQSLGTLTNNTSLASAGQSQQHHHHHHHPYIGMQFPPAAATASPKHSSAESLESPGAPQHQGVDSTFLANRLGSHGYNTWRNVGNELTFMQGATAADPNPHTQSLSEKVTGFSTVEHSSVSGLCARATNLKRTPLPNQQLGISQNGMSIQLDQRQQVSEAHVQGLSLSLSPQQLSNMQLSCFQSQSAHPDVNGPSISEASSHENMNMLDRINNNKISGNESSFISSSRDPMQSANLPMWANASQHDKHVYPNAYASSGIQNSITSSKYFKAAQELLDEVVSVGKGVKSDAGKNQKGEKKNAATDGTSNDGAVSASTCIQEVKNENPATLSPADRQELQMKKAKLVAMLDEVDRRYRQYYHQMQIVVSMFEAAAGYGAAKTYTALALKTISRHFRSLRDAIAGQIRLTSKNLGEEDLTGSGHGEGSRLHFVDQQLRQQRALQQLGMLQQHAWRPQRGLPERAVSILRAWLFEHFLHPYPKDADKHYLARQTGLTRNQVSNWFINARVRLWKPMVEEMYMEEIKEAESQASAADSKATAENEQNKKETEPSNPRNPDNAGQDDKTLKGMNGGGGVYLNQTDTPTANLKTNHASLSNGVPPLSMVNLSESTLYHHPHVEDGDDDLRQVQNKKIRNLIHHDSSAILPSTTTMATPDMGLRAEEHDHEYILGGASSSSSKFATADGKHVGEDYSFASNKIISLDDDTGDFGSYQIDGLSRYGQEPYTHHHHHHHKFGGIGGVSLTLGLQHCDDLSLSAAAAAQHPYAGNQLPRRSDLGIESSSQFHPHQHIHSTADVGSAATTPNYDTLNLHNQKRFATHLLHDFVA